MLVYGVYFVEMFIQEDVPLSTWVAHDLSLALFSI
jgi:hypothetical protein